MTAYYLNGNLIPEGSSITLNGFTYPYSWLDGTSQAIRSSFGIEKSGDINYDPKYYWDSNRPKPLEDREEVDEEGNPLYEKILSVIDGIPTMIDSDKRLVSKGLKTNFTAEIKSTTNQLLKSTDYYIIRNQVEGLEIPTSVSEYRAAVIAEQERLISAIQACTEIEELIQVMNSVNWPRVQ